jgi:hypothetical protein
MSGKATPDLLHQRWLRAHEEDTPTQIVYRPASYRFPPSRGRTGFELKPDGTLLQIGISPTDRQQETSGTWKLEDDVLAFYSAARPEPTQRLKIASADANRMVVER